jgi:hypothetical protein
MLFVRVTPAHASLLAAWQARLTHPTITRGPIILDQMPDVRHNQSVVTNAKILGMFRILALRRTSGPT